MVIRRSPLQKKAVFVIFLLKKFAKFRIWLYIYKVINNKFNNQMVKTMKNYWFTIENEYYKALEALEAWEEVEKKHFLDDWEEAEKKEAQWNLTYYSYLLGEEEEENRRQICKSQGLSRWC